MLLRPCAKANGRCSRGTKFSEPDAAGVWRSVRYFSLLRAVASIMVLRLVGAHLGPSPVTSVGENPRLRLFRSRDAMDIDGKISHPARTLCLPRGAFIFSQARRGGMWRSDAGFQRSGQHRARETAHEVTSRGGARLTKVSCRASKHNPH